MEQEKQLSYEAFEKDWKQRHKGSVPRRRRVSSFREFFWIVFWLMVAIGAAIFSAAHTIPAAELTIFQSVPYRAQLAITAFVIVELVIFGAAAGRREIDWLKWLLLASVLVALVGNIGSSVRAVAENQGDVLNQFGGILLAVIAPVTALASGEVLHIQLDKRSAKIQATQDEFDVQYREMEAKINRDYSKLVKAQKSTPVRRASAQTDTDKQPKHIALDYLKGHPDQMFTVRSLAENAGVTNDAAHKALKMFAANGHGKTED